MDWYNRSKRSSIASGIPPYSPSNFGGGVSSYIYPHQRSQFYKNYHPLLPPSSNNSIANPNLSINQASASIDRSSYYFSQYPLYCSDWLYFSGADVDCIALSSYKEGFTNKLEIIHGIGYNKETTGGNSNGDDDKIGGTSPTNAGNQSLSQNEIIDGFDFHKVSEISVEYPITNLQWDPCMSKLSNGLSERLAASSEVLRLYKVDHQLLDQNNDYKLLQTHILANNTTNSLSSNNSSSNCDNDDINTFPPVTSFDWNKTDPSIIITSSVDTTCTVWDLHRSYAIQDKANNTTTEIASVKTQLIAHDSEVFDVKFINNSTNIFASVGNDGSMRVFDLRSLEHSTIIYEPTIPSQTSTTGSVNSSNSIHSKALLKLTTSNIDQHHLATIGANSNQVIIIDMRMPGLPVVTVDGSLGGMNSASINSIKWHPNSNCLLTGGDDCQALIWDCNSLHQLKSNTSDLGVVIDTPVLAYEEELEVNNVSWRNDQGDWMGVVSGKGFQAVSV